MCIRAVEVSRENFCVGCGFVVFAGLLVAAGLRRAALFATSARFAREMSLEVVAGAAAAAAFLPLYLSAFGDPEVCVGICCVRHQPVIYVGDSFGHLELCISTPEDPELHRLRGKLFGYPDCCVDSYVRKTGRSYRKINFQDIENVGGPVGEAWRRLTKICPAAILTAWEPCSPQCPETLRLLKQYTLAATLASEAAFFVSAAALDTDMEEEVVKTAENIVESRLYIKVNLRPDENYYRDLVEALEMSPSFIRSLEFTPAEKLLAIVQAFGKKQIGDLFK